MTEIALQAVELVRRKPEAAERMASTLTEQPLKVTEAMKKFTTEFETSLGIQRG